MLSTYIFLFCFQTGAGADRQEQEQTGADVPGELGAEVAGEPGAEVPRRLGADFTFLLRSLSLCHMGHAFAFLRGRRWGR